MALTLKPRQAVEDEIENWDDDDLDIEGGDFTFRSTSIATTAPSHHRDSISSRLSIRSDFDSNHDDEERELHLPEDNERITSDAIAEAARAGIPLPQNVPTSALMGGTIKRLGGRKLQKAIKSDDWDEDLELPGHGEGLQIKSRDGLDFPDALRQVSGPSVLSPPHSTAAPVFDINKTLKPKAMTRSLDLAQFKDDEDDDFLGDGEATIKVARSRPSKPLTNILPPMPMKRVSDIVEEDFEADFALPNDSLYLTTRQDFPRTPSSAHEDLDWAEAGSLGTRFGGTRRDGRSNRSSSASALSPSVSSSFTVESEDEGLDGLVLPMGPLKFDEILKKRQDVPNADGEVAAKQLHVQKEPLVADNDFMSGLEFEDDVFDTRKLTLNRNIKVKNVRQTSPQRPKTAVSLTFTNKPSPVPSRLPRPSTADRLNPVSEDGGPIFTKTRRSQSRLGGHASHSSLSHVSTPGTPSSAHVQPSTPRRKDFNMGPSSQKPIATAHRHEPTTTNSQLLKLKRSMPSMRAVQSPAKPLNSRYDRPPSRTDNSRPSSMSRPKTPVDVVRPGAESGMSYSRKNPLPFLPAGSSQAVSHHIITKSTSAMSFRQMEHGAPSSGDFRPLSRAVSRSTMRSPSPAKMRARGAEALARDFAAKRQITKPVKKRHFGDGFELDGFDDLPTSQSVESKYIKQPIGRGAPKALLRNKMYQNTVPERTSTPTPTTPFSPARQDNLPRFARDTNASRMAREQVLSQRVPSAAPLTTITNQWKAQVSARTGLSTISHTIAHRPKAKKAVQQKPHLIKPMGDVSKTSKAVKGMLYNPATMRWEGNEHDLAHFDFPSPTLPPPEYKEKQLATPRPALITNINASQGVQVVGGMVFDPVKMCWLKMPSSQKPRMDSRPGTGRSDMSGRDTMDGFDALDDDEEDVFKDVPDLEDKAIGRSPSKGETGGRKSMEAGGLKDEWLVGEEFDVGPEFIRRQREEEERWRRKCEKWLGSQRDVIEESEDWRWSIRDVVSQLNT